MEESLFRKIIDELAGLDYSGLLGLQSNNEPYLDKRIIGRIAHARRMCPKSFIYMYTNGTLLDMEMLVESIDAGLSFVTIDNYNDELKLNDNIRKIVNELESPQYAGYSDKVLVSVRKRNEILSNRGGTAPNKPPEEYRLYRHFRNAGCLLPFKQIVVRPTGEISLCCQDALGQVTMGDAKMQGLKEIWDGPLYKELRERLLKRGRKDLLVCRVCDDPAVTKSDLKMFLRLIYKKLLPCSGKRPVMA